VIASDPPAVIVAIKQSQGEPVGLFRLCLARPNPSTLVAVGGRAAQEFRGGPVTSRRYDVLGLPNRSPLSAARVHVNGPGAHAEPPGLANSEAV